MTRNLSSRLVRTSVPVALAVVLGASLAACGSSTDASSSTTSSTTTTTQGSGSSGTIASQVNALTSLSNDLKNSTFEATYTLTEGGTTSTVTYAQSPPKSLFKTSAGVMSINDGTNTYYCTANKSCLKTSSSPIAAQLALFDGTSFVAAAQVYAVAQPVLSALHVEVSFNDANYAGQASKCMTVTYTTNSTSAVYCVSSSTGLLTYWSVGSTSYSLTSFSTTPPDSDFMVPSDYTTVTLP
jgi:hypothetical protein